MNDVLPVRTVYGDPTSSDDTNIGLNPLTSQQPIWYAGPDVVASWVLTGRMPNVVRAIRIESSGQQRGMRSVTLGGRSIDPYSDNLFRVIVEERKRASVSESLEYFLKILANSGSYGIYAQVNRQQVGKNDAERLQLFSGEMRRRTSPVVVTEPPGPWYFPPVSALTTAGGRLLLAMLERRVLDAGGQFLAGDTDSLVIVANERGGLVPCVGGAHRLADGRPAIRALSRADVRRIVNEFDRLNPYDRSIVADSLLKIERINSDANGRPRQLYGYGISSKRYCLFTRRRSVIRVVKPSEHGLGLYYRPKEGRDPSSELPLWIAEGWYWLVARALGHDRRQPGWFRTPVMRRITSARRTS